MAAIPEQAGTIRVTDQLSFSSVDAGVVDTRQVTYITPSGQSSYTMNATATAPTVVRFELPKDEYLDSDTVAVEFDVEYAFGDGTTDSGHIMYYSSGHDFIDRLRLMQGSEELMDIQNFNHLKAFEMQHCVPRDYQERTGQILEGVAPLENATFTRVFTSGAPSKHFYLQFHEGLFGSKRFLPMKYMQQIQLEVYLSPLSTCFVRSSAAGTTFNAGDSYTIKNLRLNFDRCTISSDVDAGVQAAIALGDVKIHYPGIRCQTSVINTTTDTKTISERVTSLKGVCTIAQATSVDSDCRKAKIGNYSGMHLSQVQFKVNGVLYPPNPMDTQQILYTHLLRYTGEYGYPHSGGKMLSRVPIGTSVPLSDEPYESTFNVDDDAETSILYVAAAGENPAIPFKPETLGRNSVAFCYDFDREEHPEIISGLNTSDKQADIEMIIQRKTGQTSTHRLYHFVMYDAIFFIKSDGKVYVQR